MHAPLNDDPLAPFLFDARPFRQDILADLQLMSAYRTGAHQDKRLFCRARLEDEESRDDEESEKDGRDDGDFEQGMLPRILRLLGLLGVLDLEPLPVHQLAALHLLAPFLVQSFLLASGFRQAPAQILQLLLLERLHSLQ